ncbi:hypothetical protein BDN70DRAFT_900439 [Pholiota conissans]|uniref:Uncharacterized protein n=1 Tax=Pholiota conissans TaxID=109636 RepID=A0A9P6CN89_9AGAR|nr:hypothetical protein BDN70DRAFT_900439 [Pholiota conissans]
MYKTTMNAPGNTTYIPVTLQLNKLVKGLNYRAIELLECVLFIPPNSAVVLAISQSASASSAPIKTALSGPLPANNHNDMKMKCKKRRTKEKIGKDGKTKQQRYVDNNRAKVNAANSQRNKERRKKRKLLKAAHKAAENAVTSPDEEQPENSDDLNFNIELALSLPRSDGPLPPSDPPSPISVSEDDLDDFERLSSRFVSWSDTVDQMMVSFGRHWNARDGWKPKQSFRLTRYESQFYLNSLAGTSMLSTARGVLSSLNPKDKRWDETLGMIEYLAAYDTFMDSVRSAWKEDVA